MLLILGLFLISMGILCILQACVLRDVDFLKKIASDNHKILYDFIITDNLTRMKNGKIGQSQIFIDGSLFNKGEIEDIIKNIKNNIYEPKSSEEVKKNGAKGCKNNCDRSGIKPDSPKIHKTKA